MSGVREWVGRYVPIYGALAGVERKAIGEALVEIVLNVIFATLPIWLGGLLIGFKKYVESHSSGGVDGFLSVFFDAMYGLVSNGELLMYATATLGPTLYLGFSYFGNKTKPFPWIRPQLVLSILVTLCASALFFDGRNSGYMGSNLLVSLSIFFYLFALMLMFPAIAYNHHARSFDAERIMKEDSDEFMAGYDQHRRK